MSRGDDVRRDGHGYLDASVVANLNFSHKITPGYNDTSTFVATDQGKLCRDRPVTVDGMKISVADAGVLDVDITEVLETIGLATFGPGDSCPPSNIYLVPNLPIKSRINFQLFHPTLISRSSSTSSWLPPFPRSNGQGSTRKPEVLSNTRRSRVDHLYSTLAAWRLVYDYSPKARAG